MFDWEGGGVIGGWGCHGSVWGVGGGGGQGGGGMVLLYLRHTQMGRSWVMIGVWV